MKHDVALGALLATAFWAVGTVLFSSSSIPFLKDFAAQTAVVIAVSTTIAWAAFRLGQVRASITTAGTMTIDQAVARFELRSLYLLIQAWLFLFLVLVLLAAGAAAVWFAPNITASDIGSLTTEKKLEAIDAARRKDAARIKQLDDDPARDACREALQDALKRWKNERPVSGYAGQVLSEVVPSGDEILNSLQLGIQRLKARPSDEALDAQLFIYPCDTKRGQARYILRIPRADLDEFQMSFAGKKIVPDGLSIVMQEVRSLKERDRQLGNLYTQTSLEKLQVELGTIKEVPTAQGAGKESLFLRLLQTSITRFGLLAVVGFFVSILVSLYRYNVRLAAYYQARADLLRLMKYPVTVSDFGLMAAALTPTLEFGKSPQPPIGQLVELVKTAKESTK